MSYGMSDESQRNQDGTFKKGASGNPNGRPAKARELAYLAVTQEVCALEDWRAIVTKAKVDALAGEDGATRERGRRVLADYLIGRPKQTVSVEHDGDSIYEQYADLPDDELAALIAQTECADAAVGAGHPGVSPAAAAASVESGAAAEVRRT